MKKKDEDGADFSGDASSENIEEGLDRISDFLFLRKKQGGAGRGGRRECLRIAGKTCADVSHESFCCAAHQSTLCGVTHRVATTAGHQFFLGSGNMLANQKNLKLIRKLLRVRGVRKTGDGTAPAFCLRENVEVPHIIFFVLGVG